MRTAVLLSLVVALAAPAQSAVLCVKQRRDGSLSESVKLRDVCRSNERALAAPAIDPTTPLELALPVPSTTTTSTTSTTSTTLPLTEAEAACVGAAHGQPCVTATCFGGGHCRSTHAPGGAALACSWFSSAAVMCMASSACAEVVDVLGQWRLDTCGFTGGETGVCVNVCGTGRVP
jgi:hypothetical protein